MVSGTGHTVFAAHIGYLHAGVGLFQNRHNLGLCESGLSHRFLLRLQCQNSLQVTCRQRGEAYGVSVYPFDRRSGYRRDQANVQNYPNAFGHYEYGGGGG